MLNQALPYVYKLTHPATGEFYIGSRTANKKPWHIDLPQYRTSSKYVKPRFDEFEMQLLMEFTKGSCAYDYEQYLIKEELGNPLMLNRACHVDYKIRFSTVGKPGKKPTAETLEKMRIASTGRKHSEEAKQKIANTHKGKKPKKESIDKQRAKLIGYKHSDDMRKKVSDSLKGNQRSKGMHWYTNGVTNKTAFECPEGFWLGRTGGYKPREKKPKPPKEYNQTQFSDPLTHAENIRQANIGTRFWNNGDICVRTKDCPEGFKPGMLPRTQQRKRQNERQET